MYKVKTTPTPYYVHKLMYGKEINILLLCATFSKLPSVSECILEIMPTHITESIQQMRNMSTTWLLLMQEDLPNALCGLAELARG